MKKDNFTEDLALYGRFSDKRKAAMVAIVAYVGFLGPFASGSFMPSIPEMSEALHTSKAILNVTVAIYILVQGTTPLFWAPYARVSVLTRHPADGKRPIYFTSLTIYIFGCIGVALSKDLWSLILTRIIQGLGSAAVLSIGAGTIGDLYERARRGKAMGLFYQGVLVGPAFAPVVAGILTEYSPVKNNDSYIVGWRNIQWLQACAGLLGLVLVFVYLPETSHSRGIDDVRQARKTKREERGKPPKRDRFVVVWVNPLASLRLLIRPHILCMSLNSAFVLVSTYSLLVPLASTVAPKYDITNVAIVGLFYLAQGVGTLIVSYLMGRYSDHILKKWIKKRNGEYVPEDRLRASLIFSAIVLPGSNLALGWIMDKVSNKPTGITLCVLFLVFNGGAQIGILGPTNTYCVDVMQSRASEIIAVINCVRYIFAAAASSYITPMIDGIGIGWANTITAFINFLGFIMICICLKWGNQLRAFGMDKEEEGQTGSEKVEPQELGLENVVTRTTTFDAGVAGIAGFVEGNEVKSIQEEVDLEKRLSHINM